MIKKKNYDLLDRTAIEYTRYSFYFTLVFSFIGFIFIYFVKSFYPQIGDRLLSLGAVAALLFSGLINLLTVSMAGYLRAHKQEPFLMSSIIYAVVTVIVALVAAKYYNADVLSYTITIINLIINLPMVTYIFKVKRNAWHNGLPST
jgi:Na+-driven multidrug efflux pump